MHKQRLTALTLAGFLIQLFLPMTVIAEGACSVSAMDTVAGLGTQVTVSNCAASTSVQLQLTGPSGSTYQQTIALDTQGGAVTLIPSKNTVTAGSYHVTVAGATTTFTVMADRADDAHSAIAANPSSVAAGGSQTVTVTAVLRDRYDNPVAGRPMALISNRQSDDIVATFAETDDSGRFLWTVRPQENGVMSLVPFDIIAGKQMKLKADVTVGTATSYKPTYKAALIGNEQGGETDTTTSSDFTAATTATVDHFELELPKGVTEVNANELFSMTVKAMRGNTVVRSYIGTLVVESSDPDADLPKKGEDPKAPTTGRIDMRNVDQGERSVPLSFVLRKNGAQTISVYDKLDPSIRGEITLNVRSGGADGSSIVILDPTDGSSIKGGGHITVQGKAPSFVNLVVVVNGKDAAVGSSDSNNVFRIDTPLPTDKSEMSIFVESDNRQDRSAPVNVTIDNVAPVVQSVETNPVEGKSGKPATVFVRTEPKLAAVTATVGGVTTALSESGSGLYIGTVTAPATTGVTDLVVTAKDAVDNASTTTLKWTVNPNEVPVVQNVKASSKQGEVEITWDKVESMPIKEYKIYIAKDSEPQNFLHSVGTGKPVTSAVLKDLPSGETYQFSLTAINAEGLESPEKSVPAKATSLGFGLKATIGKQSVLLEWKPMAAIPLAQYILEFGTEPGVYAAKKSVNGQAASAVIRDLIPGVQYEFKLTPVAVTGKVLSELAETVTAVPAGDGFEVTSTDPVPTDILDGLHSGAPLNPPIRNVPSTPGSGGFSNVALAALLIASTVFGLFWLKSRRERREMREFMQLMHQRYNS